MARVHRPRPQVWKITRELIEEWTSLGSKVIQILVRLAAVRFEKTFGHYSGAIWFLADDEQAPFSWHTLETIRRRREQTSGRLYRFDEGSDRVSCNDRKEEERLLRQYRSR
jgi:hypothetical protein